MPHKHKRRDKDASVFELPPTQIAKPLPVRSTWEGVSSKSGSKTAQKTAGVKRKRGKGGQDDAPRAFKRLMAFAEGKPLRSGLDDGTRPSKKTKQQNKKRQGDAAEAAAQPAEEPAESEKPALPTILPGESMSSFSARVDAALPLSGSLVTKTVKNGKDVLGLKVWRTKKEMKMHKLYDEWREEERKIQEAKEEEAEEAEERAMDDEIANGSSWKLAEQHQLDDGAVGGKKRKGKKGRLLGESNAREDDPWAVLKKKRAEGRAGLHDVVQAPPELEKFTGKKAGVPRAVANVANIPKAAGSLRRREQLEEARQDVLSSYRKLMEEKRAAASSE